MQKLPNIDKKYRFCHYILNFLPADFLSQRGNIRLFFLDKMGILVLSVLW